MAASIYVNVELRSSLSTDELIDLIDMFRWWKASPCREYESLFFGKDSKLVRPTVNGVAYVMSHCHLMPKTDSAARDQWSRAFKRRARKTSDRVLFYVQDGEQFYLIDIVDDPGAHDIMRMADRQGKAFMLKCAEQAEAFLDGRLSLAPA